MAHDQGAVPAVRSPNAKSASARADAPHDDGIHVLPIPPGIHPLDSLAHEPELLAEVNGDGTYRSVSSAFWTIENANSRIACQITCLSRTP